MGVVTKECRIRVGERAADGPLLWRMSRVLPAVMFDIRQADLARVGRSPRGGEVTLRLEGEADEVEDALEYLEREGAALMSSDRLKGCGVGQPCVVPSAARREQLGKAAALVSSS